MDPRLRRRNGGAKAVLFLGMALLAGCGEARESDLDLLSRPPDALFEHPGRYVPDPAVEFDPQQVSGWTSTKETTEDGMAFISTFQPKSSLILPANAPAERMLKLTVWSADDDKAGGRVRVHLNGIELGMQPFRRKPNTLEFLAPKEAWFWGPNLLEMETMPRHKGPGARPMALSSVEYGEEQRVGFDLEKGRAHLPAGTGFRNLVEPLDRTTLRLESTSSGPGTLEIGFLEVDPESGASSPLDELSFELAAGDWGRALPLPSTGGNPLQIDLMWSSEDGVGLELARMEIGGGAEEPLPPIVLISMDTLGARHMSLYGYDRETTPRLSDFAKDAVVFDSCMANAPWTLPSYMAVFTGLYPESHELNPTSLGKRIEVWDRWQLAENRWTLAEMLRAMGYRTAAIVDTPWISPKFRMEQGFDFFDDSARHVPRHAFGGGIDHVVRIAEEWLDGEKRYPTFAFLQALDVHAPYLPPPDWEGHFANHLKAEDERIVKAGNTAFGYGALCEYALLPYYDWGPVPPEVDIEEQIAAYDEEILAMDEAVGNFLDTLRSEGRYDESLIIFTADHGEAFDHGFYGHAGTLYEAIVKVPLVIKLPENRFGGTRVSQSVQLTDIYPTIYSLLSKGDRGFLHGRSLLPLMEGASVAPTPVYTEGGLIVQYGVEHEGWKLIELFPDQSKSPDAVITHPRSPRDWVTENFPEVADGILSKNDLDQIMEREDFREKLSTLKDMVRGPHYELYDLNTDPDELVDLAEKRADKMEELMVLLEAEKARRRKAYEMAKPLAVQVQMSEEDLEELKKLGYVED